MFAANDIDATAVLCLCLRPYNHSFSQTGLSESKFAGDDCPDAKANPRCGDVAPQTDELSSSRLKVLVNNANNYGAPLDALSLWGFSFKEEVKDSWCRGGGKWNSETDHSSHYPRSDDRSTTGVLSASSDGVVVKLVKQSQLHHCISIPDLLRLTTPLLLSRLLCPPVPSLALLPPCHADTLSLPLPFFQPGEKPELRVVCHLSYWFIHFFATASSHPLISNFTVCDGMC